MIDFMTYLDMVKPMLELYKNSDSQLITFFMVVATFIFQPIQYNRVLKKTKNTVNDIVTSQHNECVELFNSMSHALHLANTQSVQLALQLVSKLDKHGDVSTTLDDIEGSYVEPTLTKSENRKK